VGRRDVGGSYFQEPRSGCQGEMGKLNGTSAKELQPEKKLAHRTLRPPGSDMGEKKFLLVHPFEEEEN